MKSTLSPFSSLTAVITKRRQKAIRHIEDVSLLRSTITTLLIIAVAAAVFFSLFSFHIVEGNDMFPSICDSDLVLCFRDKDLTKNDIVFYQARGELYCGRVVAKGGDRVSISAGGGFTVNGTNQSSEIIYPTYPHGDKDFTIEVPEGSVFILGDFRTEAVDSRDFGCISLDDVEKKVIVLIRHRKF